MSWVAPFVGAWIEIAEEKDKYLEYKVAPFVGAWIEMMDAHAVASGRWSLPSWERGLKSLLSARTLSIARRSLRGSVD